MSNPAPGWQQHPQHQVRIEPASQPVAVSTAAGRIARSERALCVRESRYPAVYYLPAADVDFHRLAPTDSSTYCPFKGTASYWRLEDGEDDVAWSYPQPYDECAALAGHLAFYADRVTVITDGS